MMKRRILSIILVLIMTFCLCSAAFADAKATRAYPSLSFSGTTANCSVVISAAGSRIVGALMLYHGSDIIAYWTDTGDSYLALSGSCPVVSGETYTLKVSGTVDGVAILSTPTTATCP